MSKHTRKLHFRKSHNQFRVLNSFLPHYGKSSTFQFILLAHKTFVLWKKWKERNFRRWTWMWIVKLRRTHIFFLWKNLIKWKRTNKVFYVVLNLKVTIVLLVKLQEFSGSLSFIWRFKIISRCSGPTTKIRDKFTFMLSPCQSCSVFLTIIQGRKETKEIGIREYVMWIEWATNVISAISFLH